MTIDTNTMVSITEANQNFSKVTRVVDKHGTAENSRCRRCDNNFGTINKTEYGSI